MRKAKFYPRPLMIAIGLMLATLTFFSCPPPENPPDSKTAAELVDEALALMRQKDWEGALTKFSQAYAKDASNEQALIGYAALNLAKIGTDPALTDLAVNKLGLYEYSNQMHALYSLEWFETVAVKVITGYEGANPIYGDRSYLLPKVTGMEAYNDMVDDDGDGVTGPDPGDPDDPVGFAERAFAMGAFAVSQCPTEVNTLLTSFKTMLGSRLDAALSVIDAASDSMQLALTWDMYYTTQPDEYSWPYVNGDPGSIVIGKADLLLLAAALKTFRAAVYLASVYNFTLPVEEIWDNFSSGTPSTFSPFASTNTFLHLMPDAAVSLARAKADLQDALNRSVTALNAITADRSDFFLSSGYFATDWSSMSYGFSTVALLNSKLCDSLASNQDVHIPFDLFSYDYVANSSAWPSVADSSNFTFNLGNFFSTPLNLVADFLDLVTPTYPNPANGEHDGEPVWYKLDGAGGFTVVNGATDLPADHDFSTADTQLFWLKTKDVTLNGTFPLASFVEGTESTLLHYYVNLRYTDNVVSNGSWDPGESISYVYISYYVQGIIKRASLELYNNDPIAYFSAPHYSDIMYTPNAALDTALTSHTVADYCDDLRTAIDEYFATFGESFDLTSINIFILDDTTKAMYMAYPDYIAWDSFVQAGTAGVHPSGNQMVSVGSFFWSTFFFVQIEPY